MWSDCMTSILPWKDCTSTQELVGSHITGSTWGYAGMQTARPFWLKHYSPFGPFRQQGSHVRRTCLPYGHSSGLYIHRTWSCGGPRVRWCMDLTSAI